MKFQSKEMVYVLVLIAVSVLSHDLQAQVLEEVIVTAQKREQNLQDVGIAVTAFSQDQIKALGFSNTVDITAQTPNVQLYEWSPSYTVFNIRGVSQNDFADHLEPPIAVYVDDAYVSAPGALNGLLFDVQRVEVLRGPQGTLFGRNATGGLMHFISNKPTEAGSGYLEASFGDRNLIELEGAVSGPIVKDKVLARLAVKYQEQDGYLKTNIRDVAAKDGIGVRGHLQFELSDNLELLLSGRWAKNDDLATGGYARDVATPGPDGLGVFVSRGDPFENTLNVRGYLDREIMGATGKLTWGIGDNMEFTSITDWFTMDKDYNEDTDGTPVPGFQFPTTQDFEQFSQEFRLSGETDRMRWVTGLYYLDTESDAGAGINGFAVSGYSLFLGGSRGYWSDDVSSSAVFGQIDYDLTDQITLVAGLRYSSDQKKHSYYARHYTTDSPSSTGFYDNDDGPLVTVEESCDYFFPPGDPAIPGCIAAGGYYDREVTYGPSTTPLADRTFSDVSARAQLEWRPNEDTLIYFGYNRGTKGGNWSTPVFFPINTDSFDHDAEVLDSYEIGSKLSLLDGRARINAAIFYYDYTDYQGFTLVNLAQEIDNLDAKITGAEVEMVFNPMDGLDLSLGLAFLDSEVKDFVTPAGSTVDREMPQAPGFGLNFIARYEWPALNGSMAIQMDGSYLDDQYLGLDNAPVNFEDSYFDANARISYLSPDGSWTVAAWVRNFTDSEHRIYSLDVSGAGFVNSLYAPPKSAGITASYNW